MKKIMTLAIILLSVNTYAQTVVSEKTVTLNVDISTARVKLSKAGYSVAMVKVLVPDLADVTLLNHRNEGEDAPCLATNDAFVAEDVIQNNPAIEKANFTVKLTKITTPNTEQGTCQVKLLEEVNGVIRGFQFFHSRSFLMPERNVADCR